jgi:multiple sugar transport system permease protein
VVLVIVTVVPIGRAVWTALHRSHLTAPADTQLVGLDTVRTLLASGEWWVAVATTLLLVAGVVAAQVLLGCVFAAALHRSTAAWPPARVLVLLPLAVLSVVAAVVWRDAITTGFVASWFGTDGQGVGALVAAGVGQAWRGTGLVVVVVVLALERVPRPLLRAAAADGATARQRWWRVVMPSIGPALAAITVFLALDSYRALAGPLLVDEAGGPRTAAALLWDTQFSAFELGLGAAMSVVLLLVGVLLTAILVPLLRVRRAL